MFKSIESISKASLDKKATEMQRRKPCGQQVIVNRISDQPVQLRIQLTSRERTASRKRSLASKKSSCSSAFKSLSDARPAPKKGVAAQGATKLEEKRRSSKKRRQMAEAVVIKNLERMASQRNLGPQNRTLRRAQLASQQEPASDSQVKL